MAKIENTTCCGLKELVGLDEFHTPFELVKFVTRRWLDTFDAAFLILPYNKNLDRVFFKELSEYIEKNKLGTLVKAPKRHASYEKETAVWSINRGRLFAWAGRRLNDFPFAGKHFKLKDKAYASKSRGISFGKVYQIIEVDVHQKIVYFITDNGDKNYVYASYTRIVNPKKPLWKKK